MYKTQKKRKKGFMKAGRVATSTVIFVPITRAGILLRKLKDSEERMSNVTVMVTREEIASQET